MALMIGPSIYGLKFHCTWSHGLLFHHWRVGKKVEPITWVWCLHHFHRTLEKSEEKLKDFNLVPFGCLEIIDSIYAVSNGSKVDKPITTTSMRFGLFWCAICVASFYTKLSGLILCSLLGSIILFVMLGFRIRPLVKAASTEGILF